MVYDTGHVYFEVVHVRLELASTVETSEVSFLEPNPQSDTILKFRGWSISTERGYLVPEIWLTPTVKVRHPPS